MKPEPWLALVVLVGCPAEPRTYEKWEGDAVADADSGSASEVDVSGSWTGGCEPPSTGPGEPSLEGQLDLVDDSGALTGTLSYALVDPSGTTTPHWDYVLAGRRTGLEVALALVSETTDYAFDLTTNLDTLSGTLGSPSSSPVYHCLFAR